MRNEQLFLFPELDPFKTIIKNIDYMDVSKIPVFKNVVDTKNKLENIPEDKYFLFKTGGHNRFLPKKGDIFPYIQNMDTKKILLPSLLKTYVYIIINVKNIGFAVNLSRAAASAFVVHPSPDKPLIADHKNKNRRDYSVPNLRWVSSSQNSKGKDHGGVGFFEDRQTIYTHTI